MVSRLDLFFIRELSCHPSRNLAARSVFINAHAVRPALNPLFGTARYHHQVIEIFRRTGFQNQCRFHNSDCSRILPADLRHPLFLPSNYRWMHNPVQLLNAGKLLCPGNAKRRFCQPCSIDRAVRIEDSATEMPHNFLINGFTRLHKLVGDGIGLNQVGTERHKHLAHHGFARSNSARQSDLQQSSLMSKNQFTTETRRKPFLGSVAPSETSKLSLSVFLPLNGEKIKPAKTPPPGVHAGASRPAPCSPSTWQWSTALHRRVRA